jgi:2-dehydro-3-deoxygluconokinase
MVLDVITIGDGLITFNPLSTGPLRFVHQFERKIGGAELNLILGCARLGLKTGWISRLGKDEFGRHIVNTMLGEGVDLKEVKLVEGFSTSLNFKEVHASGAGRTFYYRDSSPTITLTPDSLPVEYIKQAKVLHVTGVFPAIHEQNRKVILRAMQIAKENGVKVSFDPNIRLRLWSIEEAKKTILSYLPYVDILLTGREELGWIFESNSQDELISSLSSFVFEHVILKDGENGSFALVDNKWIHQSVVKVKNVVDTVGAGDGFDAGFLYGYINGWNLEKSLEIANAIGAMVVQVSGDNEGLPYLEEVENILGKREMIER